MTGLERRYRRFLRAYPAAYRAARGDELLGTLLEAASPGQMRPAWREVRSLVMGGLKARAAQNHRLSTPANLRLSVMLGMTIWLGYLASRRLSDLIFVWSGNVPATKEYVWVLGIGCVLIFAAIVLTWFAPRTIAVPALLVAAILAPFPGRLTAYAAFPSAVLVGLAVLAALRPERPPRAWLWWFAMLPVSGLVDAAWPVLPWVIGGIAVSTLLLLAFVLLGLLWVIVDARPTFALAVLTAIIVLTPRPAYHDTTALGVYLAVGVLLAVPSLLRMRRQAVL